MIFYSDLNLKQTFWFVAYLHFQTAYERFSSTKFNLSTRSINKNVVLIAQKNKSKAEVERENFERDKNEILEAVGFSKVIKRITNSVSFEFFKYTGLAGSVFQAEPILFRISRTK